MSKLPSTEQSPTAQELRGLISELHPRSPQEVMGDAATSSLLSSITMAGVAVAGLVLASTVLLFLLGVRPASKSTQAAADSSATTSQANSESAATSDSLASNDPSMQRTGAEGQQNTDGSNSDNSDAKNTDQSNAASAAESMGISEAAAPDSKPDSLENRLDKILDGLE